MDENPYQSPEAEGREGKPQRSFVERLTWGPLFSPDNLRQTLFGSRLAVVVLTAIVLAIFALLAVAGLLRF